MKKTQDAWYDMYLDVMAICNANESVWEEKDFFAIPYNRFITEYLRIEAPRLRQMMDATGYTDVKQAKREALLSQVKTFSRALNTYALTNDLGALKKIVYLSASDTDRLDDKGLLGFAKILVDKATPLVASLADYGITTPKITALTTAQTQFVATFEPQRVAKEAQHNATQDLEKIFELCNRILLELDERAAIFADLNPEFFQQYTNARNITDAGSRTRALTVHLTEAVSGIALPNADLRILPSGLQRKTSEQGNIWVQNMEAGEISIQCSKPGYTDKTVTAFIADGETTRLVVLMERV